jgi:hypothetical protein
LRLCVKKILSYFFTAPLQLHCCGILPAPLLSCAAAYYLNFIFKNHLTVCNLGAKQYTSSSKPPAPLQLHCCGILPAPLLSCAAVSYLNFIFKNHLTVCNLGAKQYTSSSKPSPYQ